MENTVTFDRIVFDAQLRIYDSTVINFNNKHLCMRFIKRFRRYGLKDFWCGFFMINSLQIRHRECKQDVNSIEYEYINDKSFKVVREKAWK